MLAYSLFVRYNKEGGHGRQREKLFSLARFLLSDLSRRCSLGCCSLDPLEMDTLRLAFGGHTGYAGLGATARAPQSHWTGGEIFGEFYQDGSMTQRDPKGEPCRWFVRFYRALLVLRSTDIHRCTAV